MPKDAPTPSPPQAWRCRPPRSMLLAKPRQGRTPALFACLVAWVWLASAADPGRATAFCDVRKTSDGFVALRAGPDAKARLIARMRAGDEVLVRDDVASRGGFMFVT